jgi:GT2 family glycosyltransferase
MKSKQISVTFSGQAFHNGKRLPIQKNGRARVPISWSVVITTRNRAKMLRRAIASCLSQTMACECIVVDDASTDETSTVVGEFAKVRYIKNAKSIGHSAAANAGIRAAGGEWIKPLDDDDWLASSCIEVFTSALEDARGGGFAPSLISGRAIQVDENERELSRTLPVSEIPAALRSRPLLGLMMLDEAPLGTPVQVGHSRKAALAAGGWNERRPFAHQHGDEAELWIKLAALGDAVFVPDLVGYRTDWRGGSQRSLPHVERYRSNLFLKDKIASALSCHTPTSIESYLALHWAMVAAKERDLASALKLGIRWMKDPESAVHLFDHHGLKHARKLLEPISASHLPVSTRG